MYSHRTQLFADDEAMFGIGDHDGFGEQTGIGHPQCGLLQQGLVVEQREQLLRIGFAGERPQP